MKNLLKALKKTSKDLELKEKSISIIKQKKIELTDEQTYQKNIQDPRITKKE
ncbi:19439_t:CDS:1, partial [Gigaspora rosea]